MMSTDILLPPALILILAGIVVFLTPPRWRNPLFLLFSLITLWQAWQLRAGIEVLVPFAGFQLHLVHGDSLSRIFSIIFALITLIGGLYSFHLKDRKELVAALFYAAGAQGVVLAGDYLTLFIFWEFMAISSTYLIWASGDEAGQKSGFRYLIMHLFGGGLLLAGILLQYSSMGSLIIGPIPAGIHTPAVLILLGVLLNAAMPPLHSWLPDAYPNSSVGGAVFLCALTTKSAVYVLVRVFVGWKILIIAGVLMALYGVIYALLANDIRRILAYHIISQVGYMVAGVGIGTPLAIGGTVAHAFSHILYKALLFMGAGAVLYATGKSKLTELGGLWKKMPWVVALYLVGGFSISGFPFFNGFISKSMVIAGAEAANLDWIVLLLLLASIGTFLHTCLKLPYFTWFYRERKTKVRHLPLNMYIAMGVAAFFCILFGIMPGLLYRLLPVSVDYHPYRLPHLLETTQILIFTFIAFWIFREKFAGVSKIALDMDWFYRRPAAFFQNLFVNRTAMVFIRMEKIVQAGVQMMARFAADPPSLFRTNRNTVYTPDRYRLKLESMISISVLVLVVLLFLGLFST